jgi:hypothetical protein
MCSRLRPNIVVIQESLTIGEGGVFDICKPISPAPPRKDVTDCVHHIPDYERPFQPLGLRYIRGQVLEEVLRELKIA